MIETRFHLFGVVIKLSFANEVKELILKGDMNKKDIIEIFKLPEKQQKAAWINILFSKKIEWYTPKL